jgi:23S rRNA (uracil1939-C5)-methyltransferase
MSIKFPFIIEVEAVDMGDKGSAISKDDQGRVYMVEGLIPGDRATVQAYKKRKSIIQASLLHIITPSESRVTPFCDHFGVCGGCKWQQMNYETQLRFKQKAVLDAMYRIGHLQIAEVFDIVGANQIQHYRNKMEYTFSDKRWLTEEEIKSDSVISDNNALGFHRPGAFDKIVNINKCWLQDDYSNLIRNSIKDFCEKTNYTFFNLKSQTGLMRNLILRNTSQNEWMLAVIFAYDDKEKIQQLLDFIRSSFPEIYSLQYAINSKKNDSIFDLHFITHSGKDHIIEHLGPIKYKISAKSFFQTNSDQAKTLYDITKSFAGLTGRELVYDLYCGTGSIGLYLADQAAQVVGIEEIDAAVLDAKENALLNSIDNAFFYTGDVKKLLDNEFIARHGKPDLIVTDPPRAGMHESVVQTLLEVAAPRIVYVSCNPATQARDLALLSSAYQIDKIQPVDMFPHTAHVENVALLTLKL